MSGDPQSDQLTEQFAMRARKPSTGAAVKTGKTKLFQCTGHGECRMVFTRSEHLARHMRKHTGEKPFKCIVPGCDRMFSRFDNMMQHTQTHSKVQSGGARRKQVSRKRQRMNKSGKSGRGPKQSSFNDDDGADPLPSPPRSRRGSSYDFDEKQLLINRTGSHQYDEDDDYFDESDSDASYHPPRKSHSRDGERSQHSWYGDRRPPSPDDFSPTSSSSSSDIEQRSKRQMPRVHIHPYPYKQQHYSIQHPADHQGYRPIYPVYTDHMVLPRLATYLADHPDESPESYLKHCHRSLSMPDIGVRGPRPIKATRRLSIQDLCNPIEFLENHVDDTAKEGVDLTQDEYEAIQGFGRFRVVVAEASVQQEPQE